MTERRRILLLVSYDGTHYSGFAQQTNASTIGSLLDQAIASIDPHATRVLCSSRTDAGVHARNHPVSFLTEKPLPPRAWVLSLTSKLPADVCIVCAARVPLSFDPRKDPIFKRYRYRIHQAAVEDPFLGRISWRVGQNLDVALMQEEGRSLVGEHDFRAFRSTADIRTETVRTLSRCDVTRSEKDQRQLELVVEGNRFMYNMVRIIAGTLVDVGRGRLAEGACRRALASKSRTDLGMTAPAKGLMLEHVALRTKPEDPWPDACEDDFA